MKVKLEWLNELVDLSDLSTSEIVNKLSLYSTEIENVERVLSGTNLTIGHVLTCEDHPDSDHLHVTTVDVKDEVLQIVCGAPNVKQGLKVIVAKVGAVLPGDFKIKKSKIRGIESCGMICSLEELGMEKKYVPAEYSNGIYYFKNDVEIGSDPLKELNFYDDILELGLTPNRSDMLSMLGVGYEVSAVFNRPLNFTPKTYTKTDLKNNINLFVNTNNCLAYYAKRIKNIKIKESPKWLTSRLIAFGIRPINNVVDITNYILALYGQPLHSFDADKLKDTIVVRQAYENEKIITLDNIERVLVEDDIVITDGKEVVALGGVMGCENTSVSDDTKDIILEAASFDPVHVRKTYKRLDLRSESAIRFEKGIDINRTKLALDHACYLYETLCGAQIASDDTYYLKETNKPTQIDIDKNFVSKYLGIEISNEEITNIIKRLQFDFEVKEDTITITVPTRRSDITIKADIVEEIGRIYGYEHLPNTLPACELSGKLTNYQKRRKDLKHTLCDLGLTESINYSLKENNDEFTYLFEDANDIKLIYPISSERKVLRRSLVPSLLENISYMMNRKIKDNAYFEIGKVYYNKDGVDVEEEHLALAISGVYSHTQWKGEVEVADFFTLKGILNSAISKLGITLDFEKIDEEIKEMHPNRCAKITSEGKKIGYIGQLHPKYQVEKDLKGVYVCEIKLKDILSYEKPVVIYNKISKVPSVERDLALVLNKDIPSSLIIKAIKSVDKKLISDVIIFDLYIGNKIKEDEKSIALKVVFSSDETLTNEVITNKVNKILKVLERDFNATLRA